MSNHSPYLEASWVRWSDRGALVRRDVEMVLEGLSIKKHLLNGLCEKVMQHRREDIRQLSDARRETWSRWDERLGRVEEWIGQSTALIRSASGLLSWRDLAAWFDRAHEASARYVPRLSRNVERMEKNTVQLGERLQQWSDRLTVKEMELRDFLQRQTEKSTELLVSSARKKPYLEFLYVEREEEGRLSRELKALSAEAGQVLARLARAEAWLAKKADSNPAYFEIRKNLITEPWRSFQWRLNQLAQQVLNQGLPFEEGRQRLRGIYEAVQRMRVVPEAVSPSLRPRPLLHRLFGIEDE